jgi:hypothetical protein
VDAAAHDVPVLHGHVVHRILVRAPDVAVLQEHEPALVCLQRLLRLVHGPVEPVQPHAPHQHVAAAGQVQHVPAAAIARIGDHIEAHQVQEAAIEDVEIAMQARRARSGHGLDDHRRGDRAVALLPVAGQRALRVVAGLEQDAIPGAGQRRARGHAIPRLGQRAQRLVAGQPARRIAARHRIHPQVGQRGRAHLVAGRVEGLGGRKPRRQREHDETGRGALHRMTG